MLPPGAAARTRARADRRPQVLHAPLRTPTGETTCALWLVDHLNAAGRHRAAWIDLQTAREQPDLDRALPILLSELDRAAARDLPSLARPTPDEVKALLAVPERAVLRYLSMMALDLMIHWRGARHAVEVELRRDTETDALDQLAGYVDLAGLDEGALVMFDLRREASWQDRITVREVSHAGRRIRIFGC